MLLPRTCSTMDSPAWGDQMKYDRPKFSGLCQFDLHVLFILGYTQVTVLGN